MGYLASFVFGGCFGMIITGLMMGFKEADKKAEEMEENK